MSNENKNKIDKYRLTEANKEKKEFLDAVYDPNDKAEDVEIKDSWRELSRIAKFRFPEGARHLDLTPPQRLVAIAHCLGWENKDIIKASGLKASTVSRWLNKREDIKYFIDEFNMKNAPDGDVDSKLKGLEYIGAQFLEDLFNDPSPEAARLKLDAVKTIYKLTRGDKVSVDHSGNAFGDLLNAVKDIKGTILSPQEEEELFDDEVIH